MGKTHNSNNQLKGDMIMYEYIKNGYDLMEELCIDKPQSFIDRMETLMCRHIDIFNSKTEKYLPMVDIIGEDKTKAMYPEFSNAVNCFREQVFQLFKHLEKEIHKQGER